MDLALNRLPSRFLAAIWLAFGAVVLAAGCASQAQQPTSMRDPEANFSAYKTFGWDDSAHTDASGQKKPLPLVESEHPRGHRCRVDGQGL